MRRRSLGIIIALVFLANSRSASAAPRGFAIDRFEPSERGSGFFINDTLDFKQQYALGIVGTYAHRPLVGYTGSDADTDRVDLVHHQLVVHGGGSMVLAERLRLALDAPFVLYQDGDAATLADSDDRLPAPTRKAAAGDVRIATDVRLFGNYEEPIVVAAGLRFWMPTGVSAQYAGDGAPRLGPQVMASGMFLAQRRYVWAARMAFIQRWRDDDFAGNDLGAEISESIAIGARLLSSRRLLIGPELFGSTGVSTNKAFFGKATTPIEALVGAHYDIGSDFRVGGSVGTGLTAGMGAPTFRVAVSLEWVSAKPIVRPPKPEEDEGGWTPSEPLINKPPDKPLATVTPTEIKIEESVKFETDSATLLASSDVILSEVKRVLDEHPEIKKLRVEGHTDNVGDDQYNFDLSTRRATSVVAWLIDHGISADRLTSQGFGSRQPIDTNETEAGRANNRRVVFKIVDRK